MSFKGGIRQVVCQPFSHFSHNSIWLGFSGLRHFWQDSLISQWIVSNSKILSAQTKGSFLGFSTEIIHSNVIVSSLIIAYKSDAAELPKIGFSINNITVKFAKLSAWFGAFFSIFNDLNGLESSSACQPGSRKRQFGPSRSWKSQRRPPWMSNHWNQLWQVVWIDLSFDPLKW